MPPHIVKGGGDIIKPYKGTAPSGREKKGHFNGNLKGGMEEKPRFFRSTRKLKKFSRGGKEGP